MALCVPGPMIPPREEPPGEQAVTMADEEIVEVEDLEEGFEEVETELDDADIDVEDLDEDVLEEDDEFAGLSDDDEIADLEDEEEEAEEDAEAPAGGRRPAAVVVEDEDEDEDLVTPDDVEADLDTILKDRLVSAEEASEDDDDDAELADDPRTDPGDRLQPKRADELLCNHCFLLVRTRAPGCPMGDDACPIFT